MSSRNWSVRSHLVQVDWPCAIMGDFYSGGAILRAKEFLFATLLNSCLERLSSDQREHLSSTRTLLGTASLFITSKSLLII